MKFKVENFDSRKNDVAFMLLHSMEEGDALAISEELQKNGSDELDIHLTCNGRELNIEKFVTRLDDLLDYNIKTKARELFDDIVTDKVREIVSSLDRIEQTCRSVNEQIDWTDLFDKFYDEKKYKKLAEIKKAETDKNE